MVKRYDVYEDAEFGTMREYCETGCHVDADDYAALQESHARLEKQIEGTVSFAVAFELAESHARLLEATKRLVGSLGVMVSDPDNDGDIIYGRAAIAAAQPFTET